MQSNPFSKACILALVIIVGFIACLEYYWRSRGFTTTQNDDKVLWASKRKEIYKSPDQTTVFIGGSRIKFDLDIPTWEKLTGDEVIQLALVGTPARRILRDLAKDINFKGKLIIDVAEPQFFTLDTLHRENSAKEALAYYYSETPAQKASAFINYGLESNLVLLEEGKFSLNQLLKDLPIPGRHGVFVFPTFPKEFGLTTGDRQTFMTPEFLNNPQLQKIQSDIWKGFANGKTPPLQGEGLVTLLQQTKTAIDKIRSRGGKVVFVRPPSSGFLLEGEKKNYPREQYWERLLTYTNTPGIHFEDYPEIAGFVCPEMSHVSSEDAVTYTTHLIHILKNEKGWTFPKMHASVSYIGNR